MAETAVTRPARPGDVLWEASGDGWEARVMVINTCPTARIRATLYLPVDHPRSNRKVMGQRLGRQWGYRNPDAYVPEVSISKTYTGDAIDSLVAEAVVYMQEQVRIVEEVRDAHRCR